MEISEIKQRLSIVDVLAGFGLPAKRGGRYMICCPFHPDKTPSLQIYPQTNTFCCFSSNCKAGTGDVIEFIRLYEQSSKHESILKAKSMLMSSNQASISKSAIYLRFWQACQQGIKRSHPAREYLTYRGLGGFAEADKPVMGYCSEKSMKTWAVELQKAAEKYGLIKDGKPLLRNCIVFPLLDKNRNPVGFYGRNIVSKTVHHVYVSNRKGLFPCYPESSATGLILTESVLDSLSIGMTNLALYGTNGFTAEHENAIKSLTKLEEIILFMDGDEAGRKAAGKLALKLHEMNPTWVIKVVNTPDGEDVNSLLTSHENGVLSHLLTKAKTIFDGKEAEQEPVQKLIVEEVEKPKKAVYNQLIEQSSTRFQFSTQTAIYWILGGLKNELDSLRISLHIEALDGRKYRCRPDLYESKQAEKVAKECGMKLGLNPEAVEKDLSILTDLLDEKRVTNQQTTEKPKVQPIPEKEKGNLMEFLKSENLMKKLNEQIGKSGVVGEENTRLLLLMAASTYITQNPLHVLIQGSSGSGKTHLMSSICSLLPQESVHRLTRVTDGSLYNYGEYELANQLLAFEDMDGLGEHAIYALRELQSSHMLSSSTSGKDVLGNNKGKMVIVRGPIASLACTTRGDIYEDNVSRCLTVAVDESKEQTRRVISHQNAKEAGLWNETTAEKSRLFIRRLMQLIKPLEVVNPHAHEVCLPEGIQKERRLNGIYHLLVRQVALWYQYQRKRDNQGRVIATADDLELAGKLMFECMVLKVDELDVQLRSFLEALKEYIHTKNDNAYHFSQREVRQAIGVSKTGMHRYMQSLLELEYIQIVGGHANRGYRYIISYWDDNSALRERIKSHLAEQIERIRDNK